MENRSCTDCQLYSDQICQWTGPASKSMIFRALAEKPIVGAIFTNCPTWEKCELTREEQIEAAARGMLRWFDNVYPTIKAPAFEAAREALKLVKPKPFELGDLKPPKITDGDKIAAIEKAGWRMLSDGWYRNQGNTLCRRYELDAAYEETMKPAQPSEAEQRRVVMEAGWEPGMGNHGWWLREEAFRKTLAEAYALAVGEASTSERKG